MPCLPSPIRPIPLGCQHDAAAICLLPGLYVTKKAVLDNTPFSEHITMTSVVVLLTTSAAAAAPSSPPPPPHEERSRFSCGWLHSRPEPDLVLRPIQRRNGFLCVLGRRHLDKPEAA